MGTIRSCGGRTAAGVPDFRDPTRGVYSMLRDYNLPYPEMVFQLDYFKKHPEPFYRLAKDLYPTTYKPTLCHYLVRMLAEKNLLLRHYTQNVDGLERVAGLPVDKLVEAHGSFLAEAKAHSSLFCKETEATPKSSDTRNAIKGNKRE